MQATTAPTPIPTRLGSDSAQALATGALGARILRLARVAAAVHMANGAQSHVPQPKGGVSPATRGAGA